MRVGTLRTRRTEMQLQPPGQPQALRRSSAGAASRRPQRRGASRSTLSLPLSPRLPGVQLRTDGRTGAPLVSSTTHEAERECTCVGKDRRTGASLGRLVQTEDSCDVKLNQSRITAARRQPWESWVLPSQGVKFPTEF